MSTAPRLSVIATALAASFTGTPATSVAAERAWVEVRSPHFVVIADASDKALRKVAWQFEQVHSLVPRLWPWARVKLFRPTLILAVRDEASMKALLPEYRARKGGMRPWRIHATSGETATTSPCGPTWRCAATRRA